MSHYYLGVDIGGTKSHALITDETGKAVILKEGGCGNPDAVGFEGLTRMLSALIHGALQDMGLSLDQIVCAGFGIAGYDWPSQTQAVQTAIRATGLRSPAVFVNDVELGLLAGAKEGWGLVVETGTGCNCRGIDRYGNKGRSVGYGMRFGEKAGAIEIMAEAVMPSRENGPAAAREPH